MTMEQCDKIITAKERDYIDVVYVRCQKFKGHAGMHYAFDPHFTFPFHRLDRASLDLRGPIHFGWVDEEAYWWGDAMVYGTDGSKREPEFEFREFHINGQA